MIYICCPEILILFLQILQYSFGKSCHKDLKLNWTVSISNSPVVSSPLITKLNENDKNKLVVNSLDGSLSVIELATGTEGPQWPVHFPEETFFAGPVLYDINQDGSMDIVLTTANGNVIFVSQNGTWMTSYTITLPVLMAKRKWYTVNVDTEKNVKAESDLSPKKNTKFITKDDNNKHNFENSHVVLDTHILSTPVIGDFTGDGVNSDLIIPVNYYFDDDIKTDDQRLNNLTLDQSELDLYQANGIIVIDLRTREIIYNTTLELKMKSSSLPCYVLSSPMVVDLDGSYSSVEVIIGSSSGKIHVLNKHGKDFWSFDLSDSIAGQIAVGDVNNDGNLEVIAVDSSANVMCYNKERLIWESTVSGTLTAGAQLYDINNDNKLEVIIATNDGYVWVLDSETGNVLPNWPVALGNEIYSHVLLQRQPDGSGDIVVMSDGNLNILSGSSQCLEVIPTEEISYTPVTYNQENMAFIVSTTDGAILSFHELGTNISQVQDALGIAFTNATKELNTVTTASFDIEFEIYGINPNPEFMVAISYSTETGVEYHKRKYSKFGIFSITLQSPKVEKHTYILIELCDRFKLCSEDMVFISFHHDVKEKLAIYLVLPLLVMGLLLLLLHGYPAGDLLPMWEHSHNQ